jgi:hypothetical protein
MAAALDAATETLAASASFQDRLGVGSAAAAKDHIAWDTLVDNDGLQGQRPFAILKVSTRGGNEVGEGITIDLVAGGGIIVYLADNARETADHNDSYRNFLEFCGNVIDDMEELSGFGDYLPFHDAEMILPPQRTPRNQRTTDNDYWETAFLLQYGDRES